MLFFRKRELALLLPRKEEIDGTPCSPGSRRLGLLVGRETEFPDISLRDEGFIETERALLGLFWRVSVRLAVGSDAFGYPALGVRRTDLKAIRFREMGGLLEKAETSSSWQKEIPRRCHSSWGVHGPGEAALRQDVRVLDPSRF